MTAIDTTLEPASPAQLSHVKIAIGNRSNPGSGADASSALANIDTSTLKSDEGYLVANAQRDPAAFQPLYERYVDQIYRYIYRRVGTHDEAEDLTSQTFQQALAALPAYEWRGVPFGAWLYRIAGNLVNRHRRVCGREITDEYVDRLVDERGSSDDPLEALLRKSAHAQLHAAMRRLSPDQQRALVLKYAHGLKNREVGTLLNRSEGGIKQLVHRAILALRATMTKDDVDHPALPDHIPVSNP